MSDLLSNFEDLPGAEMIQRSFLFRPLNFEQATKLKKICELASCDAGQAVIEQDSLGQALYLVIQGRLEVYQEDYDRQLTVVGPGQIFGEMSLVDDQLTSATVRALEACQLLKIPRGPFQKLLASDSELAARIYQAFCKILSRRIREMHGKIAPEARVHESPQ